MSFIISQCDYSNENHKIRRELKRMNNLRLFHDFCFCYYDSGLVRCSFYFFFFIFVCFSFSLQLPILLLMWNGVDAVTPNSEHTNERDNDDAMHHLNELPFLKHETHYTLNFSVA